jgi:hypothetical protein
MNRLNVTDARCEARQVVGAVFAGPGQRPAPLGQLPVRLPSRRLARPLLRAA